MIEIPAAVLAIGAFLRKLDFLSIGTNDLIQYTLAVDRADDAVSHLYDPLHPAVLQLIAIAIAERDTRRRCRSPSAAKWPATLQLTRLLLGLGPAQLLDASGAPAGGQAARAAVGRPATAALIAADAAHRRAGETRPDTPPAERLNG